MANLGTREPKNEMSKCSQMSHTKLRTTFNVGKGKGAHMDYYITVI